MSKMNGLHIVIVPAWWPSPESPNAGVFFTDYARAFADAGAKVGVIYPDLVSMRHLTQGTSIPWIPRIVDEELHGVPVIRIRGLHTAAGFPSVHMNRFQRWLLRGLAHYEKRYGPPDVFHAMCAIPAGWACTHLEGEPRTPVVITEHTGPFSLVMTGDRGESLARQALAAAAAVVTVSKHSRSDMKKHDIDRDIAVCGNPVSPDFTAAALPGPRMDGPPRALFVGRLVKEKGVGEVMDAAQMLESQSSVSTVDWHFAGDGPMAPDLRKHFARNVPGAKLHMHGHCERSAVVKLMAESDFMVLPTHGETFGMTVAEALCMGLPVITTRGTACAEFVDRNNGMLAQPQSPAALAIALQKVITTPNAYDRAAIAARARRRFAASTVADWYAVLFHRIKKIRIE